MLTPEIHEFLAISYKNSILHRQLRIRRHVLRFFLLFVERSVGAWGLDSRETTR